MSNTSLSDSEFDRLKTVVTNGLKTLKTSYMTVSDALGKIREKKLYKQTHQTWEEFCRDEWNIGSRMARHYINSGAVAKELAEKTGNLLPILATAMAVEKVPAGQREEVVKEAAKTGGGKVTTKGVEEAAKTIQMSAYVDEPEEAPEKPEEPPVVVLEVDETGYIIPEKILKYWQRNGEIQRLMSDVTKIKGRLKAAKDERDRAFASVNFTAVITDLTNAYTGIKQAMAHAVCPTCAGQTPDKCTLCHGKGFINELTWKQACQPHHKIREKIVANQNKKAA